MRALESIYLFYSTPRFLETEIRNWNSGNEMALGWVHELLLLLYSTLFWLFVCFDLFTFTDFLEFSLSEKGGVGMDVCGYVCGYV